MNISILIASIFFLSTFSVAEKHKDLEKRVTTKSSQRIEIRGVSGSNIQFKSWTNNEVYIKLHISISSSDNKKEEEFISSAAISVTESPDVIRFQCDTKERHDNDGWMSFFNFFKRVYVETEISGEIYVPQSNALTTDMRYGTLSLDDMKGDLNLLGTSNSLILRNCTSIQRVDNNYGKTTIENSGGSLILGATSSTISVLNFNGTMDIDADYSTISASKVSHEVRINDQSGKIRVEDIGAGVKLVARYSTIAVSRAKGFVDIISVSGKISVNDVEGIQVDADYTTVDISGVNGALGKKIIVRGQSGSLVLENATGPVSIDNPYSNMTLRTIKGNLDLSSISSTIIAEDVVGDWSSRTEYCTIKLRRIAAKRVTMTNKSNAIDVRLTTVPDKIDILNEYGNVNVQMPSGYSGTVELDAEYGSIDTNLPLKTKSGTSYKVSSGKIGSGNGSIVIETKSAGIELTEGSQ